MCGPPCFFWLSWSSLLTGNCCLWTRQRSVGGRYWVQTGGRSFVEHQTARCARKELRAADVEGKKQGSGYWRKKNEGWKNDAKIKDTEQVHLFLSLTVLFLLYQDATAVLFPSKDPRNAKHTTELYYRCKQFKQPVSLGLQDSFRQPSFTVSTLPTRLSPFSLSPPSPPLSVW